MRRAIAGLTLALVVGGAGGPVRTQAAGNGRYRVEVERLGTPADVHVEPVQSRDGKRVAYVAGAGKNLVVVVDGKKGPELDGLLNSSLVFSGDSARFAYVGWKTNGKVVAVVDGVAGREFEMVQQPTFSKNGRHIAYMAKVNGVWRPVVDGMMRPGTAETVLESSIALSDDGRHLLFGRIDRNKRQSVLRDGRVIGTYDALMEMGMLISPSGERRVLVVRRAGQWLLVNNGSMGSAFDGLSPPFFSPNKERFACGGARGDRRFVIVDGAEYGSWDKTTYAAFSPDSKHYAFLTWSREGGWRAFVDGKPGPELKGVDEVASYEFNPDPEHVRYIARSGGKWRAVVNGEARASCAGDEKVRAFEGSSIAFPELSRSWDEEKRDVAVFSRDGRRVARTHAERGGYAVSLDGTVTWLLDDLDPGSLVFSEDGKHFAYVGKDGGAWRVYVDEEPGPELKKVYGDRPRFQPDGSMVYLGLQKGTLLHVRHIPVSH